MKYNVDGVLHNWVWDDIHGVYWGHVFNDRKGRFREGTWIHTSHVREGYRNKKRGGCHIYTLNSVYRLGRKKK